MAFKMWKHRRKLDYYHLLFILISILHTVSGNPCLDVTVSPKAPSGDSCYYVPEQALTWTRARRECESRQSRLAVVTSSADMDALRTLVGGQVSNVWLGAAEQGTGYAWEDGSSLAAPLQNYPWADLNDVTQAAASRQNCVYMDTETKWVLGTCATNYGYICQFDAANRNCSSGPGSDVITLGSACFLVQYGDFSWFRARAQCGSLGGHMTRFENQTLYDRFSTQLNGAPLYQKQELWTGLRKSRWVWVTGAEVVTSFWEQTQPSGPGTCLSAHLYGPNAIWWKAQTCSTTSRFVCQKDLPVAVTDAAPTGGPPNQGGGSGLSTGLLLILLLLLIVLAVITVFLCCYYRRGRAMRKAAREHARKQRLEQQQNEAPRNPHQTNFSIFTCDSAPSGQSAANGRFRPIQSNGIQYNKQNGSIHQNGHSRQLIEADALMQNNNNPKQNLLNNSMRQKKKISKNANKYSDPIEDSYDFDAEEAALRPEKGSDSDNVFKDIRNFEPPPSAHRIEDEYSLPHDHVTRQDSEHVYEDPIDSRQGFKRDMAVYQSAELFAVRSSMRIPLPKAQAEDSLVFESIQADDIVDPQGGDQQAPPGEGQDGETDRSKYIEDVARAFDFLVSGDSVADSTAAPTAAQQTPAPAAHLTAAAALPPIAAHPTAAAASPAATDAEGKLLKRRGRKDSIRSQGKEGSGTEGEMMDSDIAKAQRRLYGEQERGGSRRGKEKQMRGQVNDGYAGTDSEIDDEKRRKRQKQRLGREGTAGTDTELDDERKKKKSSHHRHGSLRHNYTEEELEEKRRRRKERERQKQEQKNKKEQKLDLTDDDDMGLTRVGSPIAMGKLPPLMPNSNSDNKNKERKHREHKEHREHRKHRKDKKDMTPEEREERRRRHKRKREKERRRRKELASQAQPSRIQVQGKPEEEEEDSSDSVSDSGEETPGSVSGSVAGTPKKETPNSSARGGVGGRRSSAQGSHLVYDIENTGAGKGIEV